MPTRVTAGFTWRHECRGGRSGSDLAGGVDDDSAGGVSMSSPTPSYADFMGFFGGSLPSAVLAEFLPLRGGGTVVQHVPPSDGADALQALLHKVLLHLWVPRDFAGSDMIGRDMDRLSQCGGVVAKLLREVVVRGVFVTLTIARLLIAGLSGCVTTCGSRVSVGRHDIWMKTKFLPHIVLQVVGLLTRQLLLLQVYPKPSQSREYDLAPCPSESSAEIAFQAWNVVLSLQDTVPRKSVPPRERLLDRRWRERTQPRLRSSSRRVWRSAGVPD